jgi:hypothetical protein
MDDKQVSAHHVSNQLRDFASSGSIVAGVDELPRVVIDQLVESRDLVRLGSLALACKTPALRSAIPFYITTS